MEPLKIDCCTTLVFEGVTFCISKNLSI